MNSTYNHSEKLASVLKNKVPETTVWNKSKILRIAKRAGMDLERIDKLFEDDSYFFWNPEIKEGKVVLVPTLIVQLEAEELARELVTAAGLKPRTIKLSERVVEIPTPPWMEIFARNDPLWAFASEVEELIEPYMSKLQTALNESRMT